MNKLIIGLLSFAFATSGLEACVTYNPSTGTYTVSPSGCVSHGKTKHLKPVKKKLKSLKKK